MVIATTAEQRGTPVVADRDFVFRAVRQANLNVLRLALYHQTRDPDLAAMAVESRPIRGGALTAYVIAPEHAAAIRDKAVAYLGNPDRVVAPPPDKIEAGRLMAMFKGHDLPQREIDYGYEELAFTDFPRDVQWRGAPPSERLKDFMVTIVGAGISGIAAAIQFDRLGIPWRIIERHAGVGGTWFLNDYPEARVDVSTFLYQFKFEKNYPWKSYFATRDELREYLEFIVDKYRLRDRINLETELISAAWDESRRRWIIETQEKSGSVRRSDCNVVVSASGLFSTPNLPDIPGIECFAGRMFHTTGWDHSYDYTGKRVALIGNGSSGSQLMPQIAKMAESLTAFQRTPNWVTPVEGYQSQVSDEKRWLFDTMPGYWNWFTYSNYVSEQQLQDLQLLDREWQAGGGQVSQRNDKLREVLTEYIRVKVGDRVDLFDKLVPRYAPLARRLVIDNGWYDALNRDNVELVTERIERITPCGILTVDGVERHFDLIILGAGFQVSRYLWPVNYRGRDGATIEALWAKDGARAHRGMTLPGFPNFFMFYGPNGQVRAGGFHSWAEITARYIAGTIAQMIEAGAETAEIRRELFDEYNAAMDERMKELLWEEHGVGGYYVNEHGRSGVNMPWTMHEFYEFVQTPDISEYQLS